MTIKLVRTDALDCTKIELQRGEHIIGRGKLLECNDKRISREHGQLLVNDDSITIKALHLNPCFYIKKGSAETEILRLGSSLTLNNGDRFGLLPDTYWYEVLFCSEVDEPEDNETERCTEEYLVEEPANGDKNTHNSDKVNNEESRVINFNYDETLNNDSRPESPSLINNHVDETHRQQNEPELNQSDINEPVLKKPEVNEPASSNVAKSEVSEPKHESEDGSNNTSPSIKRSHSPDGNDVKKIKTENVAVKPDPDDVKPGPSDQAQAAANANNGSPSNNKPNRPRERCIYGANCYRKNPQHLSQFSHPCDADWGPGERGVCPYGVNCGKRDPRHWRDHEHPPGVLPPPGPGLKKKQKKRRHDALPGQNIVTGKRVRRAVQRQSWSDSGSDHESDPFGTDESDEWEPDSNDYSEDYV